MEARRRLQPKEDLRGNGHLPKQFQKMTTQNDNPDRPGDNDPPPPPQSQSSSLLTPVIWCILVTETGERFAYYGFRAILVLYFTHELHYSESQAIALFAYTTALAYFSPLLGALLADARWGRYYTILVFGAIYVVGLVILTISAVASLGSRNEQPQEEEEQSLTTKRWLAMTGLLLVCLGTGGIKPCVSSFGADQVGKKANPTTTTNGDDDDEIQIMDALIPPKQKNEATAAVQEKNGTHHLLLEPPLDPRETTSVQGLHSTSSSAVDNDDQVRGFFAYFYFSINVGAVSSIAIIPIVKGRFGFEAAFLIPTIFMMVAMALFFSMRRQYVHHVPGQDGSSLSTTFLLSWWLVKRNLWSSLPHWILAYAPSCMRPGPRPIIPIKQDQSHQAIPTHDHDSNDGTIRQEEDDNNNNIIELQLEDARQGLRVLPIMALLPVFWSLYDQQSSVWTLQATRMELNGLQPEQLNVVNPLQIMLFIPLFDRVIYPWMDRRNCNIRPLRRMAYGMLLAALAFFVSGMVESSIQYREIHDPEHLVNVFWQLPQITLLSVAEIFVSVTGLEFAYGTSPDRLKAFLMALFLLTTAIGDFGSGILYSTVFATLNRTTVMHFCGMLMLGNLAVFVAVSRKWEAAGEVVPQKGQAGDQELMLTSLEEETKFGKVNVAG